MPNLVFFLLIALLFSFLCSVLEAVLLSITPTFIASQPTPFSDRLTALKHDIDRPLAAILTLNTFAHTIGAAGVGAAAQDMWGRESLTAVSVVVTLILLIGSEIIPKTLGAVHWRRLAPLVERVLSLLTWGLYPVVVVCQLFTRMFRKDHEKSVLSREVVSHVAQRGYRDGLLREHERDIIDNLMKQENVHTADIMTPRGEMVSCEEKTRIVEIGPRHPAWHVSRIPVYMGDPERVTGYVLKDELLVEQLRGGRDRTLSELRRRIHRVKASAELEDLYHQLIEASEHIALVVDDDDHVVGIVTMEDVIETLLGEEIVDESDVARGAT